MSKVFGIGLSRTGTSSLNEALNILGFQSFHFPIIMKNSSFQAKLKYRLNKWGKEIGMTRSLFFDFAQESELIFEKPDGSKFDAMTDLSVARFYKELDNAFPNSKFILTVRDKESWLNSCSKFFAKGNHQFFKWQRVNIDMYGSNSFDSSLFEQAHSKHMEDVKVYFESRPNDLLIMDIPNGDGWDKLCTFLNVDKPQVTFPKANASKK